MLLSKSRFDASGISDTRSSRSAQMQLKSNSLDDLQAAVWVQAYDSAWLGRKWHTLEKLFAPDITLVSTDLLQPIVGREAVLNHLCVTMARMHVHEYNATDLRGYASGSVGIITYRWQLDWTVDGERRSGSGRDILILQPAAGAWRLAWRSQMVRHRPQVNFAFASRNGRH